MSVQTVVRIRPLVKEEIDAKHEKIELKFTNEDSSPSLLKILAEVRGKPRVFGFKHFDNVFMEDNVNEDVFTSLVRPLINSQVLLGQTASIFAYGHTGSGKTHTLIGYRGEDGIVQQAVTELCANLPDGCILELRSAEIYNDKVFDLQHKRTECTVRADIQGRFHIRSATEKLEDGRVVVRPLTARYGRESGQILQAVEQALRCRAVGSSSLHEESSRSHALLELELVSPEVQACRMAEIEAQSNVIRVGKLRDDAKIALLSTKYILNPDGKYTILPTTPEEQAPVDALDAQFEAAEAALAACVDRTSEALAQRECLGGTLVLVDLAGAEYASKGAVAGRQATEGRQINKSLLALKECIRAQNDSSIKHVPFRNSKLTMLMKRHLKADQSSTTMVSCVSVSVTHAGKSLNTLKYAQLLASSGKKK
eukprot:gnl/Dysnectes_brevis/1134_a1266_1686.p1 GENE.gnl/Dysnectes_brevis/1134_a1266_1686~~gnl/Dysnectes_brevis/1134_a1266_1686.p1  ORF type:complete len:425 (+),score=87.96 gnl/Dysnectes_brevis/1134_a1266_1686:419-1693(+)